MNSSVTIYILFGVCRLERNEDISFYDSLHFKTFKYRLIPVVILHEYKL
jgi:hypothetical protein